MLLAVGFPMFVIFFFGIFAYFLWKTFSSPSRSGSREIFEFYLAANEVLRDDERRWYGFELQEVINRGERILQFMNGAPPLVYFTLGALYNKIGDHKAAINHLAFVVENETADESTYLYPSPDLRSYVHILRKIEREPNEAPQTSAAVRALERARRNRSKALLEQSRAGFKEQKKIRREATLAQKKSKSELAESNSERAAVPSITSDTAEMSETTGITFYAENSNSDLNGKSRKKEKSIDEHYSNRKPITEVLHDIYDGK
ncbi:hypothetical protein BH10ACI1_BH10ACI1_30750 [soil metagenome]